MGKVIYICTAADIYTPHRVPEGLVLLSLSSGARAETKEAGRWLILHSGVASNSTTGDGGGFLQGLF